MVSRLVLILGDQLTPALSSLSQVDKARDVVVMAEVMGEAATQRHHPKKIALIFSAMRHFAERLRADGWRVRYSRLDDPDNSQSITGELLRRAAETGAQEVITTTPGDWRLTEALDALPLPVTRLEDSRFLATEAEFSAWAKGRKELRMEFFYRLIRRKHGLLMEGDKPAGGKWNYDAENRKPARADLFRPTLPRFAPDAITREVLDLVAQHFPDHFGDLHPFGFATTPEEAEQAATHFFRAALPEFGTYQDAMLKGEDTLYHSLLSPYLNLGLLDPLDLCRRAEAEWRAGRAPLNAAEGFIRQILGWREFVRGIHLLAGPGYTAQNALGHSRPLPAAYWGGETRMACLSDVVRATRENAYAHHIQRLMVTGNFALLAGVDPGAVHDWYLSVYADAHEWVEAPNTIGMSQFADGGMVASKPYVSSGAYIDRMSDYCGGCSYDVKARSGEAACPFNALYWHFLTRHRDRFAANHRMRPMFANLDRMDAATRDAVLDRAEAILIGMDAGKSP
ncbi:cryptochrome/photolyase family protein [Sinisalibacter lacisalsi]|uniref:Deoxyribodipyrimidine photo-lyase n=1 Tax=Sinisalibacter lacisalsi TaxID=1526570 RepID=A0ABQ1QUI1_9RHOB|nr:cryptochrome/photolyase family protein [Sinisalibacter lacisalsi]GGD44440.1 deoxyribodipyrimidine photo-lyase [Sinisalibacter lacisalsi]